MNDAAVRHTVARLLAWEDAHASFDRAVEGLAERLRGATVPGFPHSPWQLVEHLRIAQRDILDFCVDAGYEERSWPDDYWPAESTPPSDEAWERSLARYRADREQLRELATDGSLDLTEPLAHGTGQTLLRELVLAADHAAYHVGQLVMLRRVLDAWPPAESSDANAHPNG